MKLTTRGRRGRRRPAVKPLKTRLARAGVTYEQVARLADVSYRMVQYVVDGKRTSRVVMNAIARLAPETSH